tara:strand:- start:352 stop:633 length:282 start_codon:yes stop_codon:yes gene_type:complete
MSFVVIIAQNNELVNTQTGEIFLKQTICIEEQGGVEGGDCLNIKSGRRLWFNAKESQFSIGQVIPVTWADLERDYSIKPVTTNSGRTIMKINL